MRAMILRSFGPPSVFERVEWERPRPGPADVLVRVIASGTNPVDAKIRADGRWAGLELPVVLGSDASGVIEEVGVAVTDLAVGDEVWFTPEIFGNPHGTYAEYTVVPAAIVGRKPEALSHVEAAAFPLAAGTAYEAIVRRLAVKLGETVLVHGGAGGVGSFAVQLALACGARVLATASAANQATLIELGVDLPIDYAGEDFAAVALRRTGGRGVDAVFDTVGGDLIARSLPATRPFGRLATILTPTGELQGLTSHNQTLHGVFLTRERARLDALATLADAGKIWPLVEQVLPLEEVAAAHVRLDSGHGRGKVVLQIAEEEED